MGLAELFRTTWIVRRCIRIFAPTPTVDSGGSSPVHWWSPTVAIVREILRWYEYQDVDQSGLLSMQEGSDWQDLFCTRGKGLYLNCLYVMALRRAAELFEGDESDRLRRRADLVAGRINTYFWYAGDQDTSGTSRIRSAPRVRFYTIPWDARGRFRRSGI